MTRDEIAKIINESRVFQFVSDIREIEHEDFIYGTEITFNIEFPSQWADLQVSPISAVNRVEQIRFLFTDDFPEQAPQILLRPDFNDKLPHIQPYKRYDSPVPCIYEGDLIELLFQKGFSAIIQQTFDWLSRAACEDLINPEQGWEPIRRDTSNGDVIFDLYQFGDFERGIKAKYKFYHSMYAKPSGEILCEIMTSECKPTPKNIKEYIIEGHNSVKYTIATVVWPEKLSGVYIPVCNTYVPDTADDIPSLYNLAENFNCSKNLKNALSSIRTSLQAFIGYNLIFSIILTLVVKRPYNIIGTDSELEYIPYELVIDTTKYMQSKEIVAVNSITQIHKANRKLFKKISGIQTFADLKWDIIGAGSLGSKICLHLSRSGFAPATIIDSKGMRPHNIARHGLAPLGISQVFSKAANLCDAVNTMGNNAEPITENFISYIKNKESIFNEHHFILNTTASAALREQLPQFESLPTVIESALFNAGNGSVMTVEGSKHNPNTQDLMLESYYEAKENSAYQVLFDDSSVGFQNIGLGCSSLTMTTTDSRISIHASAISEHMIQNHEQLQQPEMGKLHMGLMVKNGLGTNWLSKDVPKLNVIQAHKKPEWTVRIHDRVHQEIYCDISKYPGVETGGIIVGKVFPLSKVINIVDIIDAPSDSKRNPALFTLGTNKLKQKIDEYHSSINNSLYVLGTWHNHLIPSSFSATDIKTLGVLCNGYGYAVMLIAHENGYECIVAQ